jgi:hypothetical protein
MFHSFFHRREILLQYINVLQQYVEDVVIQEIFLVNVLVASTIVAYESGRRGLRVSFFVVFETVLVIVRRVR